MNLPGPRLVPVALALLFLLLAPVAGARVTYKAKPTGPEPACAPLPGPSPDTPARPRDRVGLNFTAPMLVSADSAVVHVCALVDTLGIVRQARVERGGTPYDSAAVDAVHWWWFEPARRAGRPLASRVSVAVTVHPPVNADPITPDVLALALAAEAQGQSRDALDAWTGALERAGIHPTLGNEWVMRERILRLAVASGAPPVPIDVKASAQTAYQRMLRDISRATNEDLAKIFDRALIDAPWYVDAYRWRACARAASGQRSGALRDLLCYEIATRDSAALATTDRALAELATGDTLAALTLLKRE